VLKFPGDVVSFEVGLVEHRASQALTQH
jgi:hypothetical protein